MCIPYNGITLAWPELFSAITSSSSFRSRTVSSPLQLSFKPLWGLILSVRLQRTTLCCLNSLSLRAPVRFHTSPLPCTSTMLLCFILLTISEPRCLLLSSTPYGSATVVSVKDNITATCTPEICWVIPQPPTESTRITLLRLSTSCPPSCIAALSRYACSWHDTVHLLLET